MIVLLILVPLCAALALFFLPLPAQRLLAVASGLVSLMLAALLPNLANVDAPWLSSLGLYFAFSGAGACGFLTLTASLVMLPLLTFAAYRIRKHTGRFLSLLLVFQAFLTGIFLAQDALLFYMFWELTLIPSALLLAYWGRERRRQATIKYLLYAVSSSFLLLAAIIGTKVLSAAPSFRMVDLLAYAPNLPVSTQIGLFLGYFAAFAVKLPLWPLHNWFIDFHEQNHPSGIADVAGTLYKVGGWGFFAYALPLLPEAAQLLAPYLLVLAAVTAMYGAVIATSQTELKKLVAYASLSHMGIIGVGIFSLYRTGLSGAMYMLAAQMLSTGAFFLIIGMLYTRRQSLEMDAFGGLAKSAPLFASLSLTVIFASIGVPGLSNFPGEILSLMGAFAHNPVIATFATLSVIAAAVYGVNMYQRIYLVDAERDVKDLGGLELTVLLPLLAGILWFGILPNVGLSHIDVQASLIRGYDFAPPGHLSRATSAAAHGIPQGIPGHGAQGVTEEGDSGH